MKQIFIDTKNPDHLMLIYWKTQSDSWFNPTIYTEPKAVVVNGSYCLKVIDQGRLCQHHDKNTQYVYHSTVEMHDNRGDEEILNEARSQIMLEIFNV